MINLPRDAQFNWNQPNTSDLFGNVFITKNITFDTQGYMRLSYSPRQSMDETVDADFDNPAVILFSDDYGYFVATWDAAFSASTEILSTRPTQIATAGVPSTDTQTDAVWFGGLMPVSQDTDVDYYDPSANTWTDTNISLTANGQHQMVNFVSLSALAVADVNTVKLYATPLTATPTLITTLTIGVDFEITGMCYFNQNLYIGTQNVYGGHAMMYVWNGLGTAAQQVYETDSNIIFSLCAHQDAVFLLTGNGSLLRFNGGGFDLAAGFPIFYQDQALADETNIGMYKNIMKSNGNLLYILFTNQENDNNRLLSMPDGVWCYDEKIGLYHRYALSNSLVTPETIATASVNTTTNEITVSGSYFTGTEVYYNNAGTLIPELLNNTKYYVIRVDATHIKLAYTLAEAEAGTAIDLTGTGFATQKLIFFPNIDYGQYFTNRTMALNVIERPVTNRQYGTDLLYGAGVLSRTMTDLETLGTVSDGVEARGYYISPKIFSTEITDNYDLVTLKFSPFTSETDKIIIKYRTTDDMKQFVKLSDWDMTWTSATTFTSTETGWANAAVGNEVEVLQGAGGGLLAHITSIVNNAGTYTVTLDDSFDNYVSGDLGVAIFRNWIKWKTVEYGDSNANQYFLAEHIGAGGKFLQLKIELRGVSVRIEELLVDNVFRLPAKDK
jgi:hypothetical protein